VPAASADGRYGGSDLTTDVLDQTEQLEEASPPRRRRLGDVAFFVLFGAYFAGSVVVLVLGVGAVLASWSPELHETFHVRALATGQIARAYQRMADASHPPHLPSAPLIWLGLVFSLFNLALALFLIWLRPLDRTARLFAFGMVGTAGVFNLTSMATLEILPLTGIESTIQALAHITAGLAYTYALILFPDGRPVPRWPWPALAALYLPFTAAAIFLALRVEGTARPGALILFFGIVVPVAGVAAQAYRFRVSEDPAEHQQARLLFWALLPALAVGVWFVATQGVSIEVGLAGRHLPEQPVQIFRVFQPVFLLVPLAIVLGLLRYRLWDIDRVINRTLVYGLVTGLLLGAYLGIVVLLQRLLRPFTAGNDIAVATSTLAAAAAVVPVPRRVQDFVDRRFYRHRYDAQQEIQAFGSRLRDQLDLEAMASELRGVVARTMQPSQLTLLVKGPEGRLRWQWTYRGRPNS
jgi:hypothetical protein